MTSRRRFLLWSLALTPVVQWFLWVAYGVFAEPDYIVCTSWHGDVAPCSFAKVLIESIINIIILNVLTIGAAFAAVWVTIDGLVYARSKPGTKGDTATDDDFDWNTGHLCVCCRH